jgi:hypothetical protein
MSASTKCPRQQNVPVNKNVHVNKMFALTKMSALTKCLYRQNVCVNKNVGVSKMLASTKCSCRQNVGVDKIYKTKIRRAHSLFWPGKVHSDGLLSALAGDSPLEGAVPSLCRCWVTATACRPAYMGTTLPVLSRPGWTGPTPGTLALSHSWPPMLHWVPLSGSVLLALPISIHAGPSTDCTSLRLSPFIRLWLTCLGIQLWLSIPISRSTFPAGLASQVHQPSVCRNLSSMSVGIFVAPSWVIWATPIPLTVCTCHH